MIGLRHEVGSDWQGYLNYLDSLREKTLSEAFSINEPGYLILNWLAANVWGSIYTVNITCAAILMWGVTSFSSLQPRPLLTIMVAFPYLLIVVGMGYTRQSVAIGFVMLAIVAIYKKNYLRFISIVILASLFHKTALIFFIIGILINEKKGLRNILIIGLTGSMILMYEYFEHLMNIYLIGDFQSEGALIRLAMIAAPAVVYLLYHKQIGGSEEVKKLWRTMSWTGIFLLLLLIWFPEKSTAIDRIALYWLPLQFMVLSHIPSLWKITINKTSYSTVVVIASSVAVMLIWLFLSINSKAWIPYQFHQWLKF